MNPIGPHLARLGHLNQQQIQLFQRVRHSRKKAVGLPALNGRDLRLCILSAMVVGEEKAAEPRIELC